MKISDAIKGIRNHWKAEAAVATGGLLAYGVATNDYKPAAVLITFITLGAGLTKALHRHRAFMNRTSGLPVSSPELAKKEKQSKKSSSENVANLREHMRVFWERNDPQGPKAP